MAETISDTKSIVFAGGGTGGHLLPGIAVAEQLVALGQCRITFVGSNRSVEQQIIKSSGYQHLPLPSSSTSDLKRAPFRFLWNNSRAFFRTRRFLIREKPAVVIGLGGFASVPAVLAASRLKIPIVLLEQNTVPGRANRFLFPLSNLVCTSFAETPFEIKMTRKTVIPEIVFTGNPIRQEIVQAVSQKEKSTTPSDKTSILVLGGSQGATAVNAAVISMLEEYLDKISGPLHMVHQTGILDFSKIEQKYELLQERHPNLKVTVQPFFNDLKNWYLQADLVISRAGATTLAELACVGCPTVLIPFPGSIGDHQLKNARFYADRGAATIALQSKESDSTVRLLEETITVLLEEDERRRQMRQAMQELSLPGAARHVADEVVKLIAR